MTLKPNAPNQAIVLEFLEDVPDSNPPVIRFRFPPFDATRGGTFDLEDVTSGLVPRGVIRPAPLEDPEAERIAAEIEAAERAIAEHEADDGPEEVEESAPDPDAPDIDPDDLGGAPP
jgi:hypothetical protein